MQTARCFIIRVHDPSELGLAVRKNFHLKTRTAKPTLFIFPMPESGFLVPQDERKNTVSNDAKFDRFFY